MRYLVLGAGKQGSACALDLLQHTDATVTIADKDTHHLPAFLSRQSRLEVRTLDVHDAAAVAALMKGACAVLSALPDRKSVV